LLVSESKTRSRHPRAGVFLAAVFGAILAIDADIGRMVRASDACRRLMNIPGVGQLTALACTATAVGEAAE
jgi:transposase